MNLKQRVKALHRALVRQGRFVEAYWVFILLKREYVYLDENSIEHAELRRLLTKLGCYMTCIRVSLVTREEIAKLHKEVKRKAEKNERY